MHGIYQRLKRPFLAGVALTGMALMMTLLGPSMTFPSLTEVAQAAGNGYGFAPQRYQSGYSYGNGIFFAPYAFTLYSEPKSGAQSIGTIRWSHKTSGNNIEWISPAGDRHAIYADHTFFCFYPLLDVAMMAVTSDTDDGWVEVIYDQASGKTGWVQTRLQPEPAAASPASAQSGSKVAATEPAHFGVYQTWQEFMKLNAKAHGIYWLTGVKEYNRSIRSSDADEAKLIPVTIIRDLKVKHVRGNWLLVEVLDFERNTPIGWVRWRNDDGKLMVFPNLSGQHMPIVTTAF
ncbi:hypothetical protein [Vampirovibrio chlorellavorus]|uniref:hypothetical protein n=1 Tax=Vampirovibrio chlorellavorus TaxID=758823 RepID=UPI0026F28974|nr:hypothetical protein [Vampirovibrio chlorellavorus]